MARAQSYSFSNVQVEGNQRIETATILSFLGFGQGETVSAGEVNDAAQRIRDTGLFETVSVTPRGGTLVIAVDENPTVNRINFEGNSRLGDEELAPLVRTQARRVYSPSQAEADTARIVEAYAEQGRINASVTPRIIRRSDNRVDLVFEISEGGVSEVERISFVGNRTYSDRRLRRVLETKQAGLLRAIIQNDTFVSDRIEFDRQVLTDFYRSRGYVDFEVLNVDAALTRARDAYLITFNVQEGQKFRVGDVQVTSEVPEADPAMFEQALKLRSGVVYSPTLIERDIARLERLAIREGLNLVRADPRISRNDRALTLDVNFALTRGERIFVERIDIEGNSTTLDRVIRSQFDVVEGDPFNPRQIRQSAERIRALGFFSNVDVNTREGSNPDQVVVDVDVDEGPTGSLSFGGNYSTDNGFSLLASYNQRNLLGRGQALAFDLQWSEDAQNLSLDFTEPRLLGRDLRFGFSVDYRQTDNQGSTLYDTRSFGLRPSLNFPVSENGRLTVYYEYDYTDLFNIETDSTFIEDDKGAVGTNSLGYTYSFDTRRSGLNPTAGVLLRFGQQFGFGDNTFIKTSARATAQTMVLNEEVTLRATLEGGALAYNDGESRITDRYFLGSRMMRGFEPGGIGPRDDASDDALGGNYFAVARLEAELPLGLPEEYGITGGVFLDHGSVWDIGQPMTKGNVLYNDYTPRTIAGVSIFWTTPIGPLRFNFSEPIDVQPEDKTQGFDLTISTEF
ncbi:MAG: outer membrane protein assembly factor BamA [Salibaculum sp.]|nr:outer membrane protein assembly factor BamA [Salibaculum sp.]MDR9428183.1 outer membrane protein assembly factor BamA [Salibaculum sp.]MDR9482367.1 outer membrane protein assembly factor BamA [Salibaculum sp.]